MNSAPAPLAGSHLRAYQAIVENSLTEVPTWSAVKELLEQIATVAVDSNGNLAVSRQGRMLVLHPALTRDIGESGELRVLREFLRASEANPTLITGRDPHFLLVLNGNVARAFRCQVIGGVPQLVLPYEPSAPAPGDQPARKPRVRKTPESRTVFEVAAELLEVAGQVVVLGAGAAGETDAFLQWLAQHDTELRSRIVATRQLEPGHTSPTDLLEVARAVYHQLYPMAVAVPAVEEDDPWSRSRARWREEDLRRAAERQGGR